LGPRLPAEQIDEMMAGIIDITRRDFLNGVALTVAAGLTPAAQLNAQGLAQPGRYPPALMGMRGQHDGSFEVAHDLRDGKAFALDGVPIEESYDLVVVGGGISGLAAAWFYQRARPDARILILENLDDFGGHAKRNEFHIDGRLIIGYGGSESLQSPKALYSAVAKGLLRDLGVDITRFETAFERGFYPSLGLSRGLFFSRETFGRDALVTGDPMDVVDDDLSRSQLNGRPLAEFVADFPISAAGRAQLLGLYRQSKDPLAGKTHDEKIELLKKTSYRDYLVKICGCSEEVANCFQGRTLDFFAVGCDAVAAEDLRPFGYPGFGGLGLPKEVSPERAEPYIYHFPDGNASLARLLVRALIPAAAPGSAAWSSAMDEVVLAPFDYGKLDTAASNVRIRLDSTCVQVRNAGAGVELAYMRAGKLHRVAGKHAVLACFHMVIPYIMPELPRAQRAALAQNIKAPLVYSNVLVRNWQPWVKLGVHEISAPMSIHSLIKLDYPVNLGGYRHPRDPSEPMLIHMSYVPVAPGHDARTRPGRVFERARHCGDHGQPLVARLQLRREHAVRRRRLRARAGARPADRRPRRHRQYRCRWRRLRPSRHGSGRARRARLGGVSARPISASSTIWYRN
jgi:spermidine dehydrogenase